MSALYKDFFFKTKLQNSPLISQTFFCTEGFSIHCWWVLKVTWKRPCADGEAEKSTLPHQSCELRLHTHTDTHMHTHTQTHAHACIHTHIPLQEKKQLSVGLTHVFAGHSSDPQILLKPKFYAERRRIVRARLPAMWSGGGLPQCTSPTLFPFHLFPWRRLCVQWAVL